MSALGALMRKELIALRRDSHALAALFLMPVVFIVLMSLALERLYEPRLDALRHAVHGVDDSAAARRLQARWAADHGEGVPLPTDWRSRLARGELDYVLELEAGFARALGEPGTPPAPVAWLHTEPGLDGGALARLQADLGAALGELRAMMMMARALGESPSGDFSIRPFVGLRQAGEQPRAASSVQQNVPAWLVFGMFFVSAAISSLVVQEREHGTLARLVSLGVSPRSQLLAKALPYMAVNGVQAALMLAVGVFLMPLLGAAGFSLAGVSWPALVLVVAAISVASVGTGLLIAALVRTHTQANTVAPLCNILMAAVGGIMVPTFAMPAAMQAAARLSPMNWSLEGLLAVVLRHGGLAEAAPWALRLVLFGLLALVVGERLFRRRLT